MNDCTYYKKLKDFDLEFPDIYNVLIETPVAFTRESVKNRSSLEGHNQFFSGWVRTVYNYQKFGSNVMILKGHAISET